MSNKKQNIQSKYKEEYASKLIEHMGKGFSFSSFSKIVDVTPKCLYDWVDIHESFSDAKAKGEQHAKYLFESKLLEKLDNYESAPDAGVGKFMLNARFRDEYSENKNNNVKVERLEDLINSLTIPES